VLVPPDSDDPIMAKRAHIRTWSNKAQRVGFAAYGVATIGFFLGLATSFSDPLVTLIVAMLIAGSIVLAIAIQVGYAIKGAERHEEDSIAMRKKR
jgi:O-antigen/teichoic acid export membrane protein